MLRPMNRAKAHWRARVAKRSNAPVCKTGGFMPSEVRTLPLAPCGIGYVVRRQRSEQNTKWADPILGTTSNVVAKFDLAPADLAQRLEQLFLARKSAASAGIAQWLEQRFCKP